MRLIQRLKQILQGEGAIVSQLVEDTADLPSHSVHLLPEKCAIPARRQGVIVTVRHFYSRIRNEFRDMAVCFNFEGAGDGARVVEVFTIPEKTGAEMDALLADGCKGFSIAMRAGVSIAALAERMGDLREEGETAGDPASCLGTILHAGAALEAWRPSENIVGDWEGRA